MKRSIINALPLLPALALAPWLALAQPVPRPPGQISYQGFLTDASGLPLATNAPVNYNVVFRIYDASTGGIEKWAEQQVVTVDRGYFTVMLGNGSSIDSNFTNNLTSVFSGPNASDRYLEMTVQGLAPGDPPIAPRLRLLASPYALLAANAVNAGSLQNSTNGQVVTVDGPNVGINKSNPSSALDVNGMITATTVNATTVNATNGMGIIPIGGIIMWSGNSVPAGWALCDGQNGTPNLTNRFVRGASGLGPYVTGGSDTHTHTVDPPSTTTGGPSGTTDVAGLGGQAVASSGHSHSVNIPPFTSGIATNIPAYYALAFIMRIQ